MTVDDLGHIGQISNDGVANALASCDQVREIFHAQSEAGSPALEFPPVGCCVGKDRR